MRTRRHVTRIVDGACGSGSSRMQRPGGGEFETGLGGSKDWTMLIRHSVSR
jgi:hypothetical protein